jgi:CDP-diacylglycerol---glycerol-3-phosphate 3-phosphatidyltransferase
MMSARSFARYLWPSGASAQERLRGTVWERVGSAHLLYAALLGIGRGLGALGITANALTYAALALAFAAGFAAGFGHLVVAVMFVALSGVCDALDGVVARATGSQSRYGALLDSTVDRLADACPLVGLAVLYRTSGLAWLVPMFALIGAFAISYVRARAETLGLTLPPLFMRRAERVVLLIFSLLLGSIQCHGVQLPAPLTLLGVSLIAVLNAVAFIWALRTAKLAFSAELVSEKKASGR